MNDPERPVPRRAFGREAAFVGGGSRLTVVSHPCVLPVNQAVYGALQSQGWEVSLVVPSRWRHEYSPTPVHPRAMPGLESRLSTLPVVLAGRPQRHLYLTRPARVLKDRTPAVLFCEAQAFSLPALQWGRAAQRLGLAFGVQADENLDRALPAPAIWVQRWVLAHAAFVLARSPAAARRLERLGARGVVEVAPHAVPAWSPVARQVPAVLTIGSAGPVIGRVLSTARARPPVTGETDGR